MAVLKVWDGSAWVEVGGGGGGATLGRGADAARPAQGTAGRLYLPTDGFAAHEDDGASYRQFGPLSALTAPDDSQFAWINQGGASVVAQNSGIFLLGPNQGAADNIRIRKKAAPATPYTVTARILPALFAKNYQQCGLLWRQSSDGKLVTFGLNFNSAGGNQIVVVAKWNSPTSISANYTSVPVFNVWAWLRLRDDGTTRYVYVSGDGANWMLIHSVGRTDFLTADEVGFFVNANNNAAPNLDCGMTLLSWVEA